MNMGVQIYLIKKMVSYTLRSEIAGFYFTILITIIFPFRFVRDFRMYKIQFCVPDITTTDTSLRILQVDLLCEFTFSTLSALAIISPVLGPTK